jgi:cobalt/nickel transport system permease protein
VSHLHIPDGVLPVLVWAPGLALALLLLVASARASGDGARRLGYQGALGALMLAAMAVEVPLGPFEYHLSLIGPLGVLVGAAAGYQVVFVVVSILAFVGHGGFTVVGLNALVLGAGTAIARPLYRLLARRRSPAASLAGATAAAQALSSALWLAVVALALRLRPGFAPAVGHDPRALTFGTVAVTLWGFGIVVETLVALGIGRFVGRVRPDLLPATKDVKA